MIVLIRFFFGKPFLTGDFPKYRPRIYSPRKRWVWEGLSLLPRKTMLFKQNLSSKFPRTKPFKQNLSSKIQLLWHIFTLKRLSYGIRFKTMLSMTKSWASFSWNPPLQHGSILVLQKPHWPCEWTHTISVARLQAGQICICRLVISYFHHPLEILILSKPHAHLP